MDSLVSIGTFSFLNLSNFLISIPETVREMEEYTASEDEDPSKSPKENEKPNQSKKSVKKTPVKKSPAKKSAAPSKTKQGSIMSFFTKK